MTRSKFNVDTSAAGIEARTCDGIVFHSVREKDAYVGFRAMLRSGAIAKLELQVPFVLLAARLEESPTGSMYEPVPVGKLVVDFVITELNGVKRAYDSKGVRTPVFALKAKLFHVNYKNIRLVEI